MSEKALDLFETMTEPPNNVIHAIAFTACALLRNERAIALGNRLFLTLRRDDEKDTVLIGSMLNMLMKFGRVEDAEHLFSQIRQPTVAHYGAMMHGYNTNHQPKLAWTLFDTLKQKNFVLNDSVHFALINAASQIGMRSLCRTVVAQLPAHCRNNLKLSNALIDMWVCSLAFLFSSVSRSTVMISNHSPFQGKSLVVDEAKQIFQSIADPDEYTYNTMSEFAFSHSSHSVSSHHERLVNAYGRVGMGAEAVDLYWHMPEKLRGAITHICVLNACSHAGLLDQATNIYQRIPGKTDKIVTTMVD